MPTEIRLRPKPRPDWGAAILAALACAPLAIAIPAGIGSADPENVAGLAAGAAGATRLAPASRVPEVRCGTGAPRRLCHGWPTRHLAAAPAP